jgi:hypothetical protein
MVKKAFLFMAYTLFFLLAVVYFAPKENLYYLLEQKLATHGFIIADEKIKEGSFSLEIDEAQLYFESIKSADISHAKFLTLLVYNSLEIQNIELDEISAPFLPSKIDNISIKQSILNPFALHVKAQGEFGKIDMQYNILRGHLKGVMIPSYIMLQKYPSTVHMFTANQNGEYIYEKDI